MISCEMIENDYLVMAKVSPTWVTSPESVHEDEQVVVHFYVLVVDEKSNQRITL